MQITTSFWDITTGGPDNGVGTGLPTAQMKQRTTFEGAGWDFLGAPPTWSIVEDCFYPQLFGIEIPISSLSDFQLLANVPSGNFFLTKDIDASGVSNFTPIGTLAQPFSGTLDGRGHRITGLHISRPAQDGVGLFGCLGASGVVRDLGLDGADITGRDQTGGLVGRNLGTVEQCYACGSITGGNSVGGLVGTNAGSVEQSYAAATLSGTTTGGLVGLDETGSVSTSFWDTSVSGTGDSGGGVGLATAALWDRGTYMNANWDFADQWAIVDGLSYPYFKNSVLLRVVTPPSRFINTDTVDIIIETFVPGLFVTVGGGAYPAYAKVGEPGLATITVQLKQNAINRLLVAAVSETGSETVAERYNVYESASFPSIPTAITGLTLTPDILSLAATTTQQFTCLATFADNTTGDVTPAANWNVTGGTITAAGLYTQSTTQGTVQALLYAGQGWIYTNTATIIPTKGVAKVSPGQISGVVRSNYTGLGLPTGRVTVYNILNPLLVGQYPVTDTLGNYTFFMPEGKYHFEGANAGFRSELLRGGIMLELPKLLSPGPPEQYSEGYYSGQIKANRPLSYDFTLRPNDSGAPWVVFIEPVANTTVNTDRIVVTAIDADQYSELSVAKYTHNAQEYAIPDKISSTGFYRDTWALQLGLNVLHLYTMDTEGNASEKTIQITYDPAYNTPGGDSDGDGMPNAWETAHGLDPQSAEGVNGAAGDLDSDGLSNFDEYQRGMMPNSSRSDSDSLEDGLEVSLGTNPLAADTDGDGINDDVERDLGGDPLRDDRIKTGIVNLADGAQVRGNAVTLLADILPGYSAGSVGSVSIEMRGTATGGVWRVLGTAVTSPFAATWDTTAFADGAYQVRAVATSRMGCVDGSPATIAVTVTSSAPYYERVEGGVHTLSAPVASTANTTLTLRDGARFARITIPAGAINANDTLTAFFPNASGFTPALTTFQQDARLYLDLYLATHTGNFLNGKCATIAMGYPDADRDDHLDDTGLRVPMLSVNYLPTPSAQFVPLAAPTLDRAMGCVVGETTHFSTFGVIEEQPAPPLNLMTDSLPQGTVGVAYAVALDANGGVAPYTWSVASGALPDGLGISGSNLLGTPTTAGPFTFTLRVADAQSTPFTAERSFTVEVFAANQPTVTVVHASGQTGITNTLPARWTITFSEAVTGFDTSDVTITGTASNSAGFGVTGSGATYTLEVTSLTRDGTLHPRILAGKAAGAFATNRASANEEEIWVDRRKPQVTITANPPGSQTYGATGPIIVQTLPMMFTLTFDENVTGLSAAGITFADLATQPTFTVNGSGKSYNILVTAADAGVTLTPSVNADAAMDSAGNGIVATTYTGRAIRYMPETRPTVTINQTGAQVDPTNAYPITYNIVFSAPVTGFAKSDVTYIGTPTNPQYTVTGSGANYTLTVTGATGDGRVAFRIPEDVVDGGNAASTSTDNTVSYDGTPPRLSIDPPSATKTRQGPVSFAVQYGGATAVTLNASHITLHGVPTAQISVTGTGVQTRVVTLTGISGIGPLGIGVAAGTARDAAGNSAPAAGPSATVDVDPRLTVTVNQPTNLRDPNNRLPITFDVAFAEPVIGFDGGDVTMGGTASGVTYSVTGSGADYTIRVTAVTNPGTLMPSIAAGVCQGVWGGLNVASTFTDNSVTYDPTLALAMFSAVPREGGAPLTVQFRDESILGTLPIVNWQWEFGDGETSDQPNPKHVYQEPGDYTVSLTVSTANGSDMWTENDYITVRQAIPLMDCTGIAGMALLMSLAIVVVSRRAKE